MIRNGLSSELCVSVCCNRDHFYPPESNCYRNSSFPGAETIFPDTNDSNLSISRMKEFLPRYGRACPGNTICYPDSNSTRGLLIYLLENGTIYIANLMKDGLSVCRPNGGLSDCQIYRLGSEDYCLTSQVTENGTNSVVSVCESFFNSNSFLNSQSFYTTMYGDTIFYTVTMSLSLPFLVATFIVYTILPELRNLHGLIVRTYMACVSSFFIINIVTNNTSLDDNFVFFSVLSSMLWLNVMCFDIWWTFRTLQDKTEPKKRNIKKFIIYSIYAWGSSALMTLSIVEQIPSDFIYVYVILMIMIICNVCFFVLTAIKIRRHKKDTANHLEGAENKRHNEEKQRFNVYLKLFIIMGATWSVELVEFLWTDVPNSVSYILEIPNMLQGLAIFIIFVCNKKIKRLLLKRLGFKDKQPPAVELNG